MHAFIRLETRGFALVIYTCRPHVSHRPAFTRAPRVSAAFRSLFARFRSFYSGASGRGDSRIGFSGEINNDFECRLMECTGVYCSGKQTGFLWGVAKTFRCEIWTLSKDIVQMDSTPSHLSSAVGLGKANRLCVCVCVLIVYVLVVTLFFCLPCVYLIPFECMSE